MKKTNKKISSKTISILLPLSILIFVVLNVFNVINSTFPHGLGLSDELIRYQSPSAPYSMLVSEKWTILDAPIENYEYTDVRTSIGSPYASLKIYVSRKSFETDTLNDVVDWGRATAGYQLLGRKEEDVSEYSNKKRKGILDEYIIDISPFIKLTWNSKYNHCFDYYFLEKGYGYKFSFCSVEKVWNNAKDLFIKLIDSIEIG
ncbi:MAG TPA: hypothetical protein PL000_13375 [Anaerolineales bacterium]|nr:hypothetical protein [Anaerolineales bacterium]HNF36052.1 hypothetical protein [Anaerolineales bacterium]